MKTEFKDGSGGGNGGGDGFHPGRSCKTQLLEIGMWVMAFVNVAWGIA